MNMKAIVERDEKTSDKKGQKTHIFLLKEFIKKRGHKTKEYKKHQTPKEFKM